MPTTSLAEDPALELGIHKPTRPTFLRTRHRPADRLQRQARMSSGLATALAAKEVCTDVIGSDGSATIPEMHISKSAFPEFSRKPESRIAFAKQKLFRIFSFTTPRSSGYVAFSSPKILHILWNNKFEHFDRTFLMLYYKALGKKNALHCAQCESRQTRRGRLVA